MNCDIDQYYRNVNVPDWNQWTSKRIRYCISQKGCVLLECSEAMYNLLENVHENDRIKMAVGHIDCYTLRDFVRNHATRFIPFYIDDTSSEHTPVCLSSRTVYHLPISKLPQDFVIQILKQENVSDFQILYHPDFASLKSLIATLTGQQETPQPSIGKSCKNLILLAT